MKFLFLILILHSIQQASAEYVLKTREDLDRARKECIVELGIPMTLVGDYQKRIFTPEGVTPCYISCVFKRLELFKEEDGFDTIGYLKQLGKGDGVRDGEAGVRDGVIGCYDKIATDSCMRAFNTYMCFSKGGFLPEGY